MNLDIYKDKRAVGAFHHKAPSGLSIKKTKRSACADIVKSGEICYVNHEYKIMQYVKYKERIIRL